MHPRTRLGIGLCLLAMLAERDQWLNGQTMPDSRSNAQNSVSSNCLGGLAGGLNGELAARTCRVVEGKTDLPCRLSQVRCWKVPTFHPPLQVLFDMIILELD